MTLGGLERAERQHDDVRLVRLHLHVRLLGLVADRESGGEHGAEPRRDRAAALVVVGDNERAQGIEGRAGTHVRAVFWLLPLLLRRRPKRKA
jgi:hypothetical protein